MGGDWKLMRSFRNSKKKRELEEQRRLKAMEAKEEEVDYVSKVKAKAQIASASIGSAVSSDVSSKNAESYRKTFETSSPSKHAAIAINESDQQSSSYSRTEGRARTSLDSSASTRHMSPGENKLARPNSSGSSYPSSAVKLKFDDKWLNPPKKHKQHHACTTTTTIRNTETSAVPRAPPLQSHSPQHGWNLDQRSNSQDSASIGKRGKIRQTTSNYDSSDDDIDDEALLAHFRSSRQSDKNNLRQSASTSADLTVNHSNSKGGKTTLDVMQEGDPDKDGDDSLLDPSPLGRHRSQQSPEIEKIENLQKGGLTSLSSKMKPATNSTKRSAVDLSSESDTEMDSVRKKLNMSASLSPDDPRKNTSKSNDVYTGKHMEEAAAVLGDEDNTEGEQPRRPVDADLWDDSEDELNKEEDVEPVKKKRRSSGENSKKKINKKVENRRRSTSQSPREHCDHDLHNEGLLHLEENELRNALHPTFEKPTFGPFELKPFLLSKRSDGDDGIDTGPRHEVPASINRYLLDYQREGIEFMYNTLVTAKKGAVLGHDMGLGKTVQVLSLLCALFNKTGTAMDLLELDRRKKLIQDRMETFRLQQERALVQGDIIDVPEALSTCDQDELNLSKEWFPVVIIVPKTVLQNWRNEFATWSHFGLAVYNSGGERETALERIRCGSCEVLLTTHPCFQQSDVFKQLNSISWKLVIIDEFHKFKNPKGINSTHLRSMKAGHNCRVLGLTGTLMQNEHKELWNLIDLVETDFLGTWKEFKNEVANPIKIGRTKTANDDARLRSEEKNRALTRKLDEIYLQRKKEDVLCDQLPKKDEKVMFCELSSLQKRIYEHVLTLPDYELLRIAQLPCDCGRNKEFFKKYIRLASVAERLAYYRRNKDDVYKMRKCCYGRPYNPRRYEPNQPEIDPDAVLWRYHDAHVDDQKCKHCPYCIMFPALNKLNLLSSHVALLQVDPTLSSAEEGSKDNLKYIKDMEFARVAFPSDIIDQLAGGTVMRNDGVMDDHFLLSGKMKMLDRVLKQYKNDFARVLIFSYSTKTLDLIQNYVRSAGHSFLRMDGQTSEAKRNEYQDRFNKDESIFLFLLSTKAMGLGLNLTVANRVIIFDVEWNPSWDEQAQDRAYRIGQRQDVQVLRLVAQGTLDELRYLRQLYKVQLKQETLENVDAPDRKAAPRLFRGVQGDRDRKGELFGTENLLKYKDGKFITDIWKGGDSKSPSRKMREFGVQDILQGVNEESCMELFDQDASVEMLDRAAHVVVRREEADGQIEQRVGDVSTGVQNERGTLQPMTGTLNHGDLFRDDRGRAAIEEGDDGFEEEMGGVSQNLVDIVGRMGDQLAEDGSEEEGELEAVNHEDFFRDDRGGAAIGEGEDGFDEEMGGSSQNMVDIVERGLRLELPENPQDGSCTPTEGSAPNSPTRLQQDEGDQARIPANPSPRRSSEMLPPLPPEDDFEGRMREARAARELSISLNARRQSRERQTQDVGNEREDAPNDHLQEPGESGVEEDIPASKSPRAGSRQSILMPEAPTSASTTFTEADIPFPTYRSKKKKRSKKRNNNDA